jgi:hypothetical protein
MAKKKTPAPLRPRGLASWQARQLHKSTQVPNMRAKQDKLACRKPVNQDAD